MKPTLAFLILPDLSFVLSNNTVMFSSGQNDQNRQNQFASFAIRYFRGVTILMKPCITSKRNNYENFSCLIEKINKEGEKSRHCASVPCRVRPLKACRSRGCRGAPDLGASVNPISTRQADYAHHMSTAPLPGFSELPTALRCARPFSLGGR